MNGYLWLTGAILAEVLGTTMLKASENFTRPGPSIVTVVSYGFAFWCLSLTLKVIPTGIVYAIWSGVGIVLISAVGWFWFKQSLDTPAMIGLGLIIAGVLVINLFSKSVGH